MHREHRGHRLGLATKAVNLRAVQAARSDLTLVVTQNAETNDYMVAINELMGFRAGRGLGRVRQAVVMAAGSRHNVIRIVVVYGSVRMTS